MNTKNILRFLVFLLPWFLSSIFIPNNTFYYQNLNLPFFAPKPWIFSVIWPILYFLIAYSISNIDKKTTTNYKIYLIINYLANQCYTLCFFTLQNNFLSFTDTIIITISSMYLYVETKIINQKFAPYLIPYIIWNIFALILSFTILILN